MRSGECVVDVDLSKEQDEFLSGHAIDGRVLFPATGYLVSRAYVNVTCLHIIRVDMQHFSLVLSHYIFIMIFFCDLHSI